jgi:hypothetical protein
MFRFTIRELVLLTLIVALGAAWWLDRQNTRLQLDRQRGFARGRAMVLERRLRAFEAQKKAAAEYKTRLAEVDVAIARAATQTVDLREDH